MTPQMPAFHIADLALATWVYVQRPGVAAAIVLIACFVAWMRYMGKKDAAAAAQRERELLVQRVNRQCVSEAKARFSQRREQVVHPWTSTDLSRADRAQKGS